jgi:hypothetical protein
MRHILHTFCNGAFWALTCINWLRRHRARTGHRAHTGWGRATETSARSDTPSAFDQLEPADGRTIGLIVTKTW